MEPRLTREMGLIPAEFLRTLPAALGHEDFTVNGLEIRVQDPGGVVEIRLRPLAPRRLGRLSLPVLQVSFVFSGFSRSRSAAFMVRLERYFHRGGG